MPRHVGAPGARVIYLDEDEGVNIIPIRWGNVI